MKTHPDTPLGRLALAARPSRPWLHIRASRWWLRVLLGAGAQQAPQAHKNWCGADLTDATHPPRSAPEAQVTPDAPRQTDSGTVRTVVRDVLLEVAPEEVPIVDGLTALDDKRVTQLLRRLKKQEDPLGFGFTDASALVTPVVWFAVNDAVRRHADAAAAAPKSRTLLRWLLRKPSKTPAVMPLTAEQLAVVRRRVLERASSAGIDGQLAAGLADAIVSRLARESGQAQRQSSESSERATRIRGELS